MIADALLRFREIIDDWDAFTDAISRPEPITLRVNRVRADRASVARALVARGFGIEPVDGQPDVLRVLSEPTPVSDSFEHWSGQIYMQQASTALAAPLLGPLPGERVLDLCAAPGGKTAHLAELMEGRGPLVAVEVNDGRIRALLGNLYRLGHTNVMVVAADGRTLPTTALFDRVLVDVPCSAQGTVRKKRGHLPPRPAGFVRQVTRAQERLLRRAVALTRPGGTILYVTCTFGPEENEAIVSRVLEDTELEVEPLDPGVPHAPGLAEFEGIRHDPRLERAVRIYPHHLDSGGLFVCRLRKPGAGPRTSDGWTSVPAVFPGEPAAGVTETLEQAHGVLESRFGVEASVLEGHRWLLRGSNLWAHGCPEWPVDDWPEGRHWRLISVGLRGIDLRGKGPARATNDLLRRLDSAVTRNRLELGDAEWRRLLDEGTLPVAERDDGPVALVARGHVTGWGFVRDGLLRHHVPRGRTGWLRAALSEPRPGGDES